MKVYKKRCLKNNSFRFIQKANIVDVLAIVWCVTPQVGHFTSDMKQNFLRYHLNFQVRTNSSLKKQAEFINRLKDSDIWSNVIIIVKQSVNPKYDSRGALAAMQVRFQ